jgi:hypothetical protein
MFNKIRLTSLVSLAAIGLLTLSACASPAVGGGAEQPHTISVNGSGSAYGKPDIAIAQIGVETRNEDPSKAVDENTGKMNSIMAALKELGIEEKDIQTTGFSVYAQQKYNPDGTPINEFTYVANNSVTITVRDLSKVGDVLGKSVAAGANSINGLSFTVSDQSKLEAEARSKAMADAKARAEQLAQTAGVTLDAPLTISEYVSQPVPFTVDVRAVSEAPSGAPVPVATGQIQVVMQVTVTYIIK